MGITINNNTIIITNIYIIDFTAVSGPNIFINTQHTVIRINKIIVNPKPISAFVINNNINVTNNTKIHAAIFIMFIYYHSLFLI